MATTYTNVAFSSHQPDQQTAVKLNKLRDDLSAAIAAGGGGTGAGDMTKAVYDTNSDNIVDQAAAVPWTGITGKPATFPPDSTAMLKSVYDINNNGKVDTCDSVSWGSVTGTPSTFAPSPHQASHVTGTDQIPSATTLVRGLMPQANGNANAFYSSDGTQKQVAYTMLSGSQPGPVAHAASHLDNGTDPIPVATISRTGSLRALNGTATTFLDGTGNWSTPAGGVNPGTWTNLSYGTGWTQNTTAQYRVEVNGSFSIVICQGIINYASGAASLAFTLPVGARPSVARGCVVAGFDSSGDTQLFQASISTGGVVTITPMVRQAFSWPSATNGSVYLDNLTFAL